MTRLAPLACLVGFLLLMGSVPAGLPFLVLGLLGLYLKRGARGLYWA